MYQMKNIINYQEEIVLPKCMYHLKNPNVSLYGEVDPFNLNISNQVMKFLSKAPNTKMAELEQRQEVLIKKLDLLYNRIKAISSICNPVAGESVVKDTPKTTKQCSAPHTTMAELEQRQEVLIKKLDLLYNRIKVAGESIVKNTTKTTIQCSVPQLEEAVLSVNPDNLPYYLNLILKEASVAVNFSWHIHSSVPNEKLPKIKAFVKTLKKSDSKPYANLRLIFSNVSANAELKLSSLSTPIVGTVNILRYLSFIYPNILPYNSDDFSVDSLLDICHLLEYSTEKTREPLVKKLFASSKDWIYNNTFSVVDVAAFNVVKQSKNTMKLAPKSWVDKCEKAFN